MRCKTGLVYNNGRPMRMSDLIYARPYLIKDNFGRDWPGVQRTARANKLKIELQKQQNMIWPVDG